MANTVLAGYYGFGNAGDELILLSLIRSLRQEEPTSHIFVLSNNPRQTQQHFGVESVHRWKPWTWLSPLLKSERFMLGGGGLLQETSGRWNHLYYLLLLVVAKVCGCRTEVVALGVDPVRYRHNRFLTRWVFNHWVDKATVRDQTSLQALKDAGVTLSLEVVPDPVFALPTDAAVEKLDRMACALSFSMGQSAGDLIVFLNDLRRHLQMPIDLLVFFPTEDEALARDISQRTASVGRVRLVRDASQLLSWIPQYRLVVASRFHALVLASRANVPFIGLGAQDKVRSLCAAKNMPHIPAHGVLQRHEILSQVSTLLGRKSSILAT